MYRVLVAETTCAPVVSQGLVARQAGGVSAMKSEALVHQVSVSSHIRSVIPQHDLAIEGERDNSAASRLDVIGDIKIV